VQLCDPQRFFSAAISFLVSIIIFVSFKNLVQSYGFYDR